MLLPGGSYAQGSAVFAWNMFSKSATYRLTILATYPEGDPRALDPRILASTANPAFAAYLPAPGEWRHEPVGPTFRSGLPSLAALACRASRGARHIDVTLEERDDLDAEPRVSKAEVLCR